MNMMIAMMIAMMIVMMIVMIMIMMMQAGTAPNCQNPYHYGYHHEHNHKMKLNIDDFVGGDDHGEKYDHEIALCLWLQPFAILIQI